MESSCLSSEPHTTIRDNILHYLGCLEFHEREAYLASISQPQSELINKERRRILRLREIIRQDQKRSFRDKNLVNSLEAWRAHPKYKSGMKQIRKWRHSKTGDSMQADISFEHTPYNPARDHKAYFIQYQGLEPVQNLPEHDSPFRGEFPDHKASVAELLSPEGTANYLSRSRATEGSVRYFHLPVNNMDWVEQAIRRYFDEDKTPASAQRRQGTLTRAETLLRPEFWSGQQHGGSHGFVHTRHLRPLCETVSSDPDKIESFPKNIVMFLPYLHWDTDRSREKISRLVDREAENHRRKQMNKELGMKEERLKARARGGLMRPNNQPVRVLAEDNRRLTLESDYGHQGTAEDNLAAAVRKWRVRYKPKLPDSPGTLDAKKSITTGHPLGRVLFDAAMLYEQMMIYRDERILEDRLYEDPPIHPRRTLDQAYYWTLKSTKSRDRDQVLFRGTTPKPETSHRYDKVNQTWPCEDVSKALSDTTRRCEQCRNEITQVSQLVMVDQLWMWILDERTIITSFPKRYGINRHSEPGVHKSIRNRINGPRKAQIRSVFDLALIIIDECSNTFFDRTKTDERHPQVLVKFSEAIGTITHKQSVAFEHLWVWTETFGKLSQSMRLPDIQKFVAPLLNINPEGKLQREIKDVIDELEIMIHITKQQKEVVKKFKKHVERVLDPENKYPDDGNSREDDNMPDNHDGASTGGSQHSNDRSQRGKLSWFRHSADELVSEIDDRLDELEGLKNTADNTSKSLDHLLELKQQQASVIQAWQSVRQSDEAVKQGRAIMIFTVFTITFLPLSFMSSVWGMNNEQLTGDLMDLWLQVKVMVWVTFGVLVITLPLAFSPFVREVLSTIFRLGFKWVMIKTGVYATWISLPFDSKLLMKKADDHITKMLLGVKKECAEKRGTELKLMGDAAIAAKQAEQDSKGDPSHVNGQATNGQATNGQATHGDTQNVMSGAIETTQQRPQQQEDSVSQQQPKTKLKKTAAGHPKHWLKFFRKRMKSNSREKPRHVEEG